MRAKITGMSQYQGAPLASSTLTLYRAERYEDGADRATVYREDFVFRPNTGADGRGTWGDRHTVGADAYTVVTGVDDPEPILGVFEETFRYADGTHVTTIFQRYLIGTNLAGTELNYTTPQTPSGPHAEPLTMQAARDLIARGGSLPAGGTAGQALLRTATGYEWGNVAGGETMYTPTKQRTLSVTNTLGYRTELVCRAAISTANAQADGRDIQVFDATGAKVPTSVRHVVPTATGADYHIAFVVTLDSGATASYTAKYGDPHAAERSVLTDALSRALSRPTRRAGALVVQLDNGAGFRPADFLTGTPSWVNNVTPDQAGPSGVQVNLAGATGEFAVTRKSSYTWATDQTAGRIEVAPTAGQVRPAFLFGVPYATVLTPAQATSGTGGAPPATGACIVGRALPDGYVIDIRATGGSLSGGIYGYADVSIRYRAGGGWVWTCHHVAASPDPALNYINGTAGVRVDAAAAVRFFGAGGLAADVSTTIARPDRSDPSTWVAFTVDAIREVTATVGAEGAI